MSRTPRTMVAAAAWCVAAFVGLLVLAYYVGPTRWLDTASLHGFVAVDRPRIDGIAHTLANSCNPLPYSLACILVIAVAAKTRGLRIASAVTLFLAGANASSQLLKPALAYHRELYHTHWHLFNLTDAAYPSGHATAAMALSVAALIIAPRPYRPVVAALGVVFTLAISFALLVIKWHFPSDIVGGYLIATAWGFLSFATLLVVNERWPERGTVRQAARGAMPAPLVAAFGLALLALAVAVGFVAATRGREIAAFAEHHTAAAAVASAIVVAAAVLLAAVVAISSSGRGRSRSR